MFHRVKCKAVDETSISFAFFLSQEITGIKMYVNANIFKLQHVYQWKRFVFFYASCQVLFVVYAMLFNLNNIEHRYKDE